MKPLSQPLRWVGGKRQLDDTDYWRNLPYAQWLELARQQSNRFWSKVDRSGDCWLWQAALGQDGYGKFQISGRGSRFQGDRQWQKTVRAHRLTWELVNGECPRGLYILHSCDAPACCDPAHLSPGTQALNIKQASERGRLLTGAEHAARRRMPRGERHYKATISDADVSQMRALKVAGHRNCDLARQFKITRAAADAILARKSWRHIA